MLTKDQSQQFWFFYFQKVKAYVLKGEHLLNDAWSSDIYYKDK